MKYDGCVPCVLYIMCITYNLFVSLNFNNNSMKSFTELLNKLV